jgi:PKD repeat protein
VRVLTKTTRMKQILLSLSLFLGLISGLSTSAQNAIELNLSTDCWGGETSWNITDNNGTEVATSAGTTYGNQETFVIPLDLADGCYSFNISDSYGDGMYGEQYGSCSVNGDYSITDVNANVLVQMTAPNADFGNGTSHDFVLPNGGGSQGCTDPLALNYDSCASTDDGSCTYEPVTASFDVALGSGCAGSSVDLTDTSTGTPTSWSWDLPGSDLGSSSDQNPTISYATPGDYTITLTASNDNGSTDVSSQTVTVTDGLMIEIQIVADNYPAETSWELEDEAGNIVANGNATGGMYCIADECHRFTMYDTYGDGICCAYGEGSFTILIDGVEVATGGEFGDSQTVNINCPPGIDCNNAIAVDLGEHTNPITDTWYTFTPASNGQYRITTCNRATCDTRIWVYDYCNMLFFDDSVEASLTYNDDFCGVQSEVTPLLAGGQTYYFRIGSADNACAGENIGFALEYVGLVQGCMDPLACNYLPIAEEPGECFLPGDPECPSIGPDLEILGDVFYNSMYYTTLVNNDECYINEGCMQGFGERQIIRFSTHIKNIGTEDYFIGDPNDQPGQFEFDDCHNHWHYEGYAEYSLFDDLGAQLPQVGFKNGFCVLDLECSDGGTAKYTCGNMGITAGCGDIYSSSLACQWVDVTDIPAGTYTLVMRTNWDQSPDANGSYELSYDNNWAAVCFSFDRDANGDVINFEKFTDCPVSFDCQGAPFGNAQPDCEGNCNGIAVKGDVNGSGDIEPADSDVYIQDILGADAVVSPCTDMDNDGNITVTDAALIAGCVYYGPDYVEPDGVHDHCVWDDEITNPNHTTTLSVGELNTELGYVDIHVLNPDNEIVGYEFEVSGMTILSVENLADPAVYDIAPQASLGGVKVIGLSFTDQTLPKNLTPVPLVRLNYLNVTGSEVCITGITDVVNEDFHNVTTVIGGCQQVAAADFADFTSDVMTVCEGEAVTYFDLSSGNPDSWSWSFGGGTPSSSNEQNPVITYNAPGTYPVTLTVTNAQGTDSETKMAFITVEAGNTWYLDSDGDTYGDPNNSIFTCDTPAGYVLNADDCDDSNAAMYLGAPGTFEGIDNNCDGNVDGDEVAPTPCMGDLNDDGMRDISDLLLILQDYGCSESCGLADVNEDGVVNNSDLLFFLPGFGTSCE